MKKITLLLCLTILTAGFIHSQDIRFDYQIKYKSNATGVTADITVSVKSGTPEFTYYLTTNHPVNGKVLVKSEPTKKQTFTFEGITPGTYFIKIQDGSGDQKGQSLIIDENEN